MREERRTKRANGKYGERARGDVEELNRCAKKTTVEVMGGPKKGRQMDSVSKK